MIDSESMYSSESKLRTGGSAVSGSSKSWRRGAESHHAASFSSFHIALMWAWAMSLSMSAESRSARFDFSDSTIFTMRISVWSYERESTLLAHIGERCF